MSAEPAPSSRPPASTACPLCSTPVPAAVLRCEVCGMTLAGTAGRPAMFTRRTLWLWAGCLLVIYLVVLVVVATVPD
jgi:hypothetical protein